MWETGSTSGCGRKERAHFHESHLKPVFHHCFFKRKTRRLFRVTQRRYRYEGILAVLSILFEIFSCCSVGCKQGIAKLIRQNKTCSHLFCDNRLISDVQGRGEGEEGSSKQRVGQKKKRSSVD